LTGSSETSVPT